MTGLCDCGERQCQNSVSAAPGTKPHIASPKAYCQQTLAPPPHWSIGASLRSPAMRQTTLGGAPTCSFRCQAQEMHISLPDSCHCCHCCHADQTKPDPMGNGAEWEGCGKAGRGGNQYGQLAPDAIPSNSSWHIPFLSSDLCQIRSWCRPSRPIAS